MRLNDNDDLVRALAMGPCKQVTYWSRYSINGLKFHTREYGKHKATMNYGVCVSSPEDVDYYGFLDEIMELSYCGEKDHYETILFRCSWMDNSLSGMNVHDQYKLVEVNHTRKYQKYDPFVLAHQAIQVYYSPYPSTRNDRNQWWAVFKTKARSQIDAPIDIIEFQEEIINDHPTLSTVEVEDELEEEENEGGGVEQLGQEGEWEWVVEGDEGEDGDGDEDGDGELEGEDEDEDGDGDEDEDEDENDEEEEDEEDEDEDEDDEDDE